MVGVVALPIARRGILGILESPLVEGVEPVPGGNGNGDFIRKLTQFQTKDQKEDLERCKAAIDDPRISFVVPDSDLRAFKGLAVVHVYEEFINPDRLIPDWASIAEVRSFLATFDEGNDLPPRLWSRFLMVALTHLQDMLDRMTNATFIDPNTCKGYWTLVYLTKELSLLTGTVLSCYLHSGKRNPLASFCKKLMSLGFTR